MPVIHVRFVEQVLGEQEEGTEAAGTLQHGSGKTLPPEKRQFSGAEENKSQQIKCAPSKFIPRSLSVVEMLKLGKAITKLTLSVDVCSFDLHQMTWSNTTSIDFCIQEEPFGRGGFREAYKVTSNAKHFQKMIKKYYPARHFAARFGDELKASENLLLFEETLMYTKIFFSKLPSNEYVIVEEFIEENFVKQVSNNGHIWTLPTLYVVRLNTLLIILLRDQTRKSW